jgi:hypothetical protein
VYMSTLQPMQTVDQGEFATKYPQLPLTSGTVTYSNGSLTFVLTGTSPNTALMPSEGDDQVGDSNSYNLGSGTTDANGNLTLTDPQDGSSGDLFEVMPYSYSNNDNGFIGGFSVPPNPVPAIQYLGTLENGTSNYGLVSVDTAGSTTVQLSGAVANVQFTVEFCPAYNAGSNQPTCLSLGTLTTDDKGDGSATTMFPQAGSWAGDFQLTSSHVVSPGTTAGYSTGVVGNDAAQVYMSALQPMTTVDQGEFNSSGSKQAPLTSGIVTYAGGSLDFVLAGAPADTAFSSSENALGLGSSDSYMLYNSQNQANFSSDSNGNAVFSVLQDGTFGDLFEVSPSSGDGYLGGFSVPKQ